MIAIAGSTELILGRAGSALIHLLGHMVEIDHLLDLGDLLDRVLDLDRGFGLPGACNQAPSRPRQHHWHEDRHGEDWRGSRFSIIFWTASSPRSAHFPLRGVAAFPFGDEEETSASPFRRIMTLQVNQKMGLSESKLATSVIAHFTTEFHRRVFQAALQSFDHEDNPLRLNNFATALRELGRLHMELHAPDGKVKACHWYKPKLNDRNQIVITRAQRAKYAVQGELHDDFVKDTLGIDVDTTVSEYTKLIDSLSKYTHISEPTFAIPDHVAEQQAVEALETFEELFELIDRHRESLLRSAANRAKDALDDVLFGEVNDELDRLATHYNVESVELYDLEVEALNNHRIRYSGSGNVACRFQYGSDADVERDDGVVTFNGYPLRCKFEANTSSPLDIAIVEDTLTVDTERFYA